MSQSTTINPSPISRKPVALSRNDPFSTPVIHCLGFFLGMTASSLSVSTLMALSSWVTRVQNLLPGGSAKSGPALAMTMSKGAYGNVTRKALGSLTAFSPEDGANIVPSHAFNICDWKLITPCMLSFLPVIDHDECTHTYSADGQEL